MAGPDRFSRYLREGERIGAAYELASPGRAPRDSAAIHRGHRPGASIEFMEHREYQAGDDLRAINWAAFARTDRLMVKTYTEEVQPHLDIVIDDSRSMDIENSSKCRTTLTLAAALAEAAHNAGFTHRAWLVGELCLPLGNSHLPASAWEGIGMTARASLDAIVTQSPSWRHHGIRILISDLMSPTHPDAIVQQLARGAAGLSILQVIARSDVDPGPAGDVRLFDIESEHEIHLRLDAAAVDHYKTALARHEQSWQEACSRAASAMITLVADDLPGDTILTPLRAAGLITPAGR